MFWIPLLNRKLDTYFRQQSPRKDRPNMSRYWTLWWNHRLCWMVLSQLSQWDFNDICILGAFLLLQDVLVNLFLLLLNLGWQHKKTTFKVALCFTLVLAVLFIPLIFKSTTMRLQFQDNVLSNHAWYFYSVDIQNLCHQIVWTVKLMAKRRCSGLRIFIFCSCEQSYQLFFGPVFRTHLSKDWVCCIQCIPLINFPADSQTSHPLRSPPLKRARLDGQARAPPQVRWAFGELVLDITGAVQPKSSDVNGFFIAIEWGFNMF